VVAKAHGGLIDIQGVTVATVDDKVRMQQVETWFDPMEMFRQIDPEGKATVTKLTAEEEAELKGTACPFAGGTTTTLPVGHPPVKSE
jgi:hypothetical protein